MLKDLLKFMVERLVDYPEAILIAERKREGLTILELAVSREDLGRVIGKNGRTVGAMRTILSAAAQSRDERVTLEVMG